MLLKCDVEVVDLRVKCGRGANVISGLRLPNNRRGANTEERRE